MANLKSYLMVNSTIFGQLLAKQLAHTQYLILIYSYSIYSYSILNDHTAPGLRGSFVRREIDQTNYHLRNTATDLTIPQPKREFLKKSFKYSGAMLWNQLPNEAKLAESPHSFKSIVGQRHAS